MMKVNLEGEYTKTNTFHTKIEMESTALILNRKSHSLYIQS